MTVDQRDARGAFAGRATVAALLAVAGAALLPVIADYLGRVTWAGVVLGIVAVGAVFLAIALLVVDRPGMLLAAAAMGALAMAVYIVTWVVAVPQLGDGIGGWTAVWGIAALVLDSLTVRAAVFTLRRRARPPSTR
ncbi:MAG: hypothetical protein ACRDRR_09495 [Pseudonocardiaceae bacterium]